MSLNIKINILSIAEKYPGQGVCSATEDHKFILEKYSNYERFENKLTGNFDILHVHTLNFQSFFSLLLNKRKSFCVTSAHVVPNSLIGSFKFSRLWVPFSKGYIRTIYNLSHKVLAVSEETKNELIKDLKLKPEKILVFRNFVRKDMFYTEKEKKNEFKDLLRKQYGYNSNDFIILGSGQVQPRKGVQDFYALAKKMPDYKFIWVGGMPFKKMTEGSNKMQKLIENAPENLTFTGTIDRSKIIDYYRMSDVFFLPSTHETFGLVIIEAAGSGLPIVLRNLEVYKDIFNPYYLSGNNNDEFKNIFEELRNNNEQYINYSEKSYELFSEYNDEKAFNKLANIYETGIKELKKSE